jgi:ABC-type transport system substrate-binding protein
MIYESFIHRTNEGYSFMTIRKGLFPVTAALLLVASGCAGQSADAPSEVPFTAGAYPVDAAAECERDDAGQLKPGLARIDAPDERTVIFTLCVTDPTFLQKMTIVTYGINDSGYLAAAAADGSILSAPNGTGPLQLISWSKDQEEVVLGRFNDYWGEKAASERIVLKWQGDSAARLVQLEAGVVDGIDNVAADDIETLSANSDYQVMKRLPVTTLFAGVNTSFKPFDDIRVRQAIAMAIDSARIVENFYPAGSAPATHYVPCAITYGCEGEAWWPTDRDRARALLAEAGYPDGFKTRIVYRDAVRASNPDPTGIATDLQAQLAEIGIDAMLEVQEATVFDANSFSGLIDGIFIRGWTPDYLDPLNFLYRNLVTNNLMFGGVVEAIAAPLRAASSKPNSPERASLFAEANNALREAAILTPLGHGSSAVAWASSVQGAHSSPITDENFADVSIAGEEQLVFLQSVEPASLYCADETENNNLRICSQINESLYTIKAGGTEIIPSLATSCESNKNLTVWTCTLRDGVRFHNGARFDAGDVRDSYAAQWDCAHPSHVGRSGLFRYWEFMSSFLNPDRCVTE